MVLSGGMGSAIRPAILPPLEWGAVHDPDLQCHRPGLESPRAVENVSLAVDTQRFALFY